MSDRKKLYNQVSPHDLEPEYTQHMMAMTGEKLHYKADIAMELAYRDKQIAALEEQLAKYRLALARYAPEVLYELENTHD